MCSTISVQDIPIGYICIVFSVKLCCWTVYSSISFWMILKTDISYSNIVPVLRKWQLNNILKFLYMIYMRVVKFKIVSWNHSALLVSFSPCIVKYSLCFTVLSCRYFFVTFSFYYHDVNICVFRFSYFLVKY